ncbi:unnamed protein product [Caretta caretta]
MDIEFFLWFTDQFMALAHQMKGFDLQDLRQPGCLQYWEQPHANSRSLFSSHLERNETESGNVHCCCSSLV